MPTISRNVEKEIETYWHVSLNENHNKLILEPFIKIPIDIEIYMHVSKKKHGVGHRANILCGMNCRGL